MSAGLTEGNSTDFISGSGSALNALVIPSTDVNNYQAAYLQVTGTFSATARVQGSNDGTNFVDVLATDISNPSASPSVTISAPGMFYVPTAFRFFQLKITAFTSGTVSALVFFQVDISGDLGPRTVNAIQSGTWTVQAVQSGTWSTGRTWTLASGTDSVAAVQSGTWTVVANEDKNYGTVGANTLRAAAQIGNATGAADFNAGAIGAQTLRVCAILANPTGSIDYNYGTVGAQTPRTAAQVGNATGAADFNAGATSAQTLRTHANQGAPNTVANAWPQKITDGTNTAAVKAASTAVAAADPSLAVGLSPNSPLPAGTNALGTVTAVGNVAHAAADSGNPVKVGGKYNATPPTLSDGQRSDLQMTADGKVKVDTSFSVLGGQLVPTITNKLRVRYSTAAATAGSAYSTIYTRSGTGLFFGFQADFNSAKVRLRLTIDGGQIFEITVEDLKLFQFNDTSTTRTQAGSFWTTIGNTVDFSIKYAIPYTTSVLIEMQRSDAANHTLNQYMVFLTEDT